MPHAHAACMPTASHYAMQTHSLGQTTTPQQCPLFRALPSMQNTDGTSPSLYLQTATKSAALCHRSTGLAPDTCAQLYTLRIESTHQPAEQPAGKPASQPASQQTSQPASQPACQPAAQHIPACLQTSLPDRTVGSQNMSQTHFRAAAAS
jgi:hypothetical protein